MKSKYKASKAQTVRREETELTVARSQKVNVGIYSKLNTAEVHVVNYRTTIEI